MARPLLRALLFLLAITQGCTCGGLDGDEGPVGYTRCSNAEPPEVDSKVNGIQLQTEGRTLRIQAPEALRIAAFTGPVLGSLSGSQLAPIKAAKAGLVLWLGGLGDDLGQATAGLKAASDLGLPVLFLAGGADRLPLVEEAFGQLDEPARSRVLHISGLRSVSLGGDSLAVLAGAPLGRYAVDEDACGFGPSDVGALDEALDTQGRVWLLSWAAPSGWDVSLGYGGQESGSPDLHALASQRGLYGGLFAYPEGQAGAVQIDEKTPGLRAVVPRLGPSGSSRSDRSRGAAGFLLLEWGTDGLTLPAEVDG